MWYWKTTGLTAKSVSIYYKIEAEKDYILEIRQHKNDKRNIKG